MLSYSRLPDKISFCPNTQVHKQNNNKKEEKMENGQVQMLRFHWAASAVSAIKLNNGNLS